MRIAIATDAWFPQVNGVVRTLAATVNELTRRGYEVELITPELFRTLAMPGYASIRVALAPRFTARRMLHAFRPDIVHIATEGPIGWSARGWCRARWCMARLTGCAPLPRRILPRGWMGW